MYAFRHRSSNRARRFIGTIRQVPSLSIPARPRRDFTSGFGAVMEQESDLQFSTERNLGSERGPHAAEFDRMLRHQQDLLGANVALLEGCFALLPYPARFHALHARVRPPTPPRRLAPADNCLEGLRTLIAQHLDLVGLLGQLSAQRRGVQRDESGLNAVAHNHQEMAAVLLALLRAIESACDPIPVPVIAAARPAKHAHQRE